jgi:hypothetical protein
VVPPGSVPDGYTLFMGMVLLDVYQLTCPETAVAGKCSLFAPLEVRQGVPHISYTQMSIMKT